MKKNMVKIEYLNAQVSSKICMFQMVAKGSSDPNHFILEINVGKSRIQQRMTLNLNDAIFNQFEPI